MFFFSEPESEPSERGHALNMAAAPTDTCPSFGSSDGVRVPAPMVGIWHRRARQPSHEAAQEGVFNPRVPLDTR